MKATQINQQEAGSYHLYGLTNENLAVARVPEPSTALLWLVGLGMFSALRRRTSTIDD